MVRKLYVITMIGKKEHVKVNALKQKKAKRDNSADYKKKS